MIKETKSRLFEKMNKPVGSLIKKNKEGGKHMLVSKISGLKEGMSLHILQKLIAYRRNIIQK